MQGEVDARPFSLPPHGRDGTRARGGALVVHGFTGTPFEVRLLGEALAARGFAVEGPLLAGHGGSTRQLAATRWPDWYGSVEAAFDRLRARTTPVAVCGLSLGGLLTLELARRRAGELAAIAVMAAPLWLESWAMALDAFLQRIPLVRDAALPKLAGADISDPEMLRRNTIANGGAAMPLAPLHSMIELGAWLRTDGRLAEVRAPALLMHGRQDHAVPYACMDAIAHRLGSPVIRKITLERSFHVLPLDVERERVFSEVAAHFLEHM
jgi:carboxylesterase